MMMIVCSRPLLLLRDILSPCLRIYSCVGIKSPGPISFFHIKGRRAQRRQFILHRDLIVSGGDKSKEHGLVLKILPVDKIMSVCGQVL